MRAEAGDKRATRALAEAYYLGRGTVKQDFQGALELIEVQPQDFVCDLERVAFLFSWKLVPRTSGRSPEKPRLCIRGTQEPDSDTLVEPIGAVYFATTCRPYRPEKWAESIKAIGLSQMDAANVVAASDDLAWETGHGNPQLDLQSLRSKLLNAVGL